MKIHIGQIIEKQVEVSALSKAEFARKIDKFPQNIKEVFGKKSIDTDLLFKISDVLEHDFFQYYYKSNQSVISEPEEFYSKKPYEVSVTIKVNDSSKELELLKLIGLSFNQNP